MHAQSNKQSSNFDRRHFNRMIGGAIASSAIACVSPHRLAAERAGPTTPKTPLGFDNFSIRSLNWKAGRLIEFAENQKLDSLLLSDLDVYENHELGYLKELKAKADQAGLTIHAGTGCICPTADRWNDKWGTAEQHLKLGIRVAKALGSPVFRCYLGGDKDRHSPGGIQKHIDATLTVLKNVKSEAVDAKVKIAVENHAGDLQGWELAGMIEAAGPDFVGATIDSGNATWTLEHPLGNLESLGRYAVTSGMRDSTVWEFDQGAKVAWNAIGEGQIDWKEYTARFAVLCPDVPFQLEIISGFNKSFAYKEKSFWDAYPDAKARDFAQFLELAGAGREIESADANKPDFQMDELLRSIRFCKTELGLGLKS